MIAQPSCSPEVLQLEVSVSTYTIAGISVHVYGLEQLPENKEKDIKTDVSCLYLLSPRLCDHTYMTGIARTVLYDYYNSKSSAKRGLICAAFDPRNHGEREVCICILIPIGARPPAKQTAIGKQRSEQGVARLQRYPRTRYVFNLPRNPARPVDDNIIPPGVHFPDAPLLAHSDPAPCRGCLARRSLGLSGCSS